MKVRVINWDSHQERADRGNFVWFKFHNRFYEDEKIHKLTPDERHAFIYLLTLCSKASGPEVDLLPAIADVMTGIDVASKLERLTEVGLIECQALPGKNRQEERRREENKYWPDLESVYQLYPKRPNQRKQFGMDRLRRGVKTPEDFTALQRAVSNYAKYCEAECKEPRHIKQFGTFSGEWREWVNQDPPMICAMYTRPEEV